MKNISIKGILAGILASLILSIPVGFMFGYYFVEIYNEVLPGININNKKELEEISNKIMFHPLSIAFMLMATLITVGVPGYITALVANKNYALNSFLFGVCLLLISLIGYEFILQSLSLFVLMAVLGLLVAYLSGLLRCKHVVNGVT